jgi:hypothetical protein
MIVCLLLWIFSVILEGQFASFYCKIVTVIQWIEGSTNKLFTQREYNIIPLYADTCFDTWFWPCKCNIKLYGTCFIFSKRALYLKVIKKLSAASNRQVHHSLHKSTGLHSEPSNSAITLSVSTFNALNQSRLTLWTGKAVKHFYILH